MNGLWIWEQYLKVYGIELGMRMTAVSCSDGVFIHSPVRPTSAIVSDLSDLGQVSWVVAPNKWHHLYVQDFKNHFPAAKFYCAPGLEKKRPDFHFNDVITNEQRFPWNTELSHLLIEGVPMYNEVVFFHPKTKTLLVTDLAVHIRKTNSLRTKLWLTLLGSYGHFGWSTIEKFVFIKDKVAFRRSLDRLMDFDFDRVIMAHGEVVEKDGKELLSSAFS
jgi:hypothetical protein